jgi:multiple sugar transport system permease protein
VRSNTGLVFALPALIVLFMLIAYPVTYTGWLSVTNEQGQFTGLRNFSDVLRPRVTTQALWNTLWWVGGSIFFQVLFGVAAAILLNQNFVGRALVRSITLIPWVIRGSSRPRPGHGCFTPSSALSTT